MIDATGFITAGGRSSRMGEDKAWLKIGGSSMIERVIAALMPVTTSVAIIANQPGYSRLGLPVFSDENPGIGPLEAIRTGLENALTSRIVLVGCDLPFVTSDLFRFLLSIENQCGQNYQTIVPIGPNGKSEPVCAIYSVESLEAVRLLIASGRRRISLLFDRVPTRLVEFEELSHLEGADLFFKNVNTRDDYLQAIAAAKKHSPLG
ncbi:MAG: molybdenum cofactor guanylyltransferase [Blastocatellia bacterium]